MRMIDDITDFIFLEDIPPGDGISMEEKHSDVIFIPGGSYPELPERAAELWKAGYAPYIVPSGRYSVTVGKFTGAKSKADVYGKDYATECEFYTDVLLSKGVALDGIFPEAEAQFTAENARFSRKILDAKGIHPKKAILCCKGAGLCGCDQGKLVSDKTGAGEGPGGIETSGDTVYSGAYAGVAECKKKSVKP